MQTKRYEILREWQTDFERWCNTKVEITVEEADGEFCLSSYLTDLQLQQVRAVWLYFGKFYLIEWREIAECDRYGVLDFSGKFHFSNDIHEIEKAVYCMWRGEGNQFMLTP